MAKQQYRIIGAKLSRDAKSEKSDFGFSQGTAFAGIEAAHSRHRPQGWQPAAASTRNSDMQLP